jgi:hypothetical protein
MSNVTRPPFVHCIPSPEGERFVIVQPEMLLSRTFPPRPGERWTEAVRRFFEGETLLTESDLRHRLAEMGLDETTASQQIERARKLTALNSVFSWEHITTIGFRNREGQEVIRKTDREGRAPAQRIFVLRCTVCDHEYGTDGCDIYERLCPKCQDGPPGLPT